MRQSVRGLTGLFWRNVDAGRSAGGDFDVPELVYHIALGMPAFVPRVAVNFNELLEDGAAAACTLGGEASGVVEMAEHVVFVLIVRVLGAEEG